MAIALVVVIVVAAFYLFAGVTYPRTLVKVPVSFTLGTDLTNTQFTQSSLDNMADVQVSVQSSVALWRARILIDENVVWEHTASLGEQQSYDSGWIPLAEGTYNFTFGIIGGVSLHAAVTVSAKEGLVSANSHGWR